MSTDGLNKECGKGPTMLSAPFLIQMDGGIGKDNAAQCALAGADVLVAGSSTFKAPDMARAIAEMK